MDIRQLVKTASFPAAYGTRWARMPLSMNLKSVKKLALANKISPAELAAQILNDSELVEQLPLTDGREGE
jgi:hypothetical protein